MTPGGGSAFVLAFVAIGFAATVVQEDAPRPLPDNLAPRFPTEARRLLVAGDASFRARVSAAGRVEEVLVLEVPARGLGFENATREAVAAWRFEPMTAPADYLGRLSFVLRPEAESAIRRLAAAIDGAAFHECASVILDDEVYRRTGGPWLREEALVSLSGRVRSIDFAAGRAATVTLDGGAVMRLLEADGAWKIVTWESRPSVLDPAEKIEDVLPVFPLDARHARRADLVVVQALIDHEGRVRHLDVVTSVPELDAAALDAARRFRFRPARRDGVAVPSVMTLTVGFAGDAP